MMKILELTKKMIIMMIVIVIVRYMYHDDSRVNM